MPLFRGLFALAVASTVAAQSSSLYFTNQPSDVYTGVPISVKYSSLKLDESATIFLRKGSPSNLETIATLTTTVTGGTFVWDPAYSLVSAGDYALEIVQGEDVNYSAEFTITNDAPATTSASLSTLESSMSMSTTYISMQATVTEPPTFSLTGYHATGASVTGGMPSANTTLTFFSPTLKATTSTIIAGGLPTTSAAHNAAHTLLGTNLIPLVVLALPLFFN